MTLALETLDDVLEIDGEYLGNTDDDLFITRNPKENSITFQLQNGPIKEVGKKWLPNHSTD